jgi:release factor glutamine methyltransferase
VSGPFDAVVSNPPYVPDGEVAALQPEVVDHEPHVALFAGPDGLAVIRPLIAQAALHLAPAGVLIFEFGVGQSDEIERLFSRAPTMELLELRRDLQGIPRTAIARRVR